MKVVVEKIHCVPGRKYKVYYGSGFLVGAVKVDSCRWSKSCFKNSLMFDLKQEFFSDCVVKKYIMKKF